MSRADQLLTLRGVVVVAGPTTCRVRCEYNQTSYWVIADQESFRLLYYSNRESKLKIGNERDRRPLDRTEGRKVILRVYERELLDQEFTNVEPRTHSIGLFWDHEEYQTHKTLGERLLPKRSKKRRPHRRQMYKVA